MSSYDELIFAPPWRDRLPDGTLGPGYGPPSPNAFVRACREHEDSIHGGGLWDESDPALPPRRVRGKAPEEWPREDEEEMRAFVHRYSAALGTRALEVWTLYWERRMSARAIARELGISKHTVNRHVQELRHRLRVASSDSGELSNGDHQSPKGVGL